MSTYLKKLWLERLFAFLCCLLLSATAYGQKVLTKNYPELNLDLTTPKNYTLLSADELSNFQESKLNRPFVSDVFKKNGSDSYITVMETLNSRSVGNIYPDQKEYYTHDNNTLLTFRGLPLDTINNVISISKKYTMTINADKALIRLATDSLLRARGKDTVRYNGKLYSHLYVTIVKNDLGAIWLTYNYEVGKLNEAIKEVYNTWGLVKFRPDGEMKRDKTDSITVYFGKFKYLNTPEILKKDALILDKLFQKDPYRLENKIIYTNLQLNKGNYKECIKTADEAINLYIQLKKSPEKLIKNEKNTHRQISNFYYLKGVAQEGLLDKIKARISYQKAKEMGYQLHPEALKLLEQNN